MGNILHPAMNSINFKGPVRDNEGPWFRSSPKSFYYEIVTMNIAVSN